MKLQQRQARETGICPVRRELYSQCFDELIRQVTINCAERGLLLLRYILVSFLCQILSVCNGLFLILNPCEYVSERRGFEISELSNYVQSA